MEVFVKKLDGKVLVIKLCDNEEQFKTVTVSDLRAKIPDCGDFRLIFAGQQLEDHNLLYDYGVRHESTIHAGLRLTGGGGPGPTAMGDKTGRNASKDHLYDFEDTEAEKREESCCII